MMNILIHVYNSVVYQSQRNKSQVGLPPPYQMKEHKTVPLLCGVNEYMTP